MKKIFSLIASLALFALLSAGFAESFNLNPVETHALFRIKRANTSFLFGRFDELSGSLSYDVENPEASSIEFLALTESVSTGIENPDNDFDAARRDGHLRSPDFFDAAQFPTLSFVSKSVAATDDPNILEVTGDLTIHGVTNEVTVMVEKTGEGQDQQGNAMVGFYTEFNINRSDYGMTNLEQLAGDEVLIMISLLGMAQ
ncbi:MAG: YceI family protein [Trueperaceae bacterium]|nr:YceI family protein [Trueperaceae bacterium]